MSSLRDKTGASMTKQEEFLSKLEPFSTKQEQDDYLNTTLRNSTGAAMTKQEENQYNSLIPKEGIMSIDQLRQLIKVRQQNEDIKKKEADDIIKKLYQQYNSGAAVNKGE
jgi:hypothetical protein